jgi:hypothetical protein
MFCEYKTKNSTLGILNGEVHVNGKVLENIYSLNVRETNGLIKEYNDKMDKDNTSHIADMKDLCKRIINLNLDLELLVRLKRVHCSTYKTIEDFEIKTTQMIKDKMVALRPLTLSIVEEAILDNISEGLLQSSLSEHEILDKYSVVKDNLSGIDALEQEFKNYDYASLEVDGEVILHKAMNTINSVKEVINNFREIKSEAGNDIVNWSSHKITRRLNDRGFKGNRWQVASLIQDHCKNLMAKGISKDNTPKKISKSQKIIDKISNSEPKEITQEEWFTLLKNSNNYKDIEKAISNMTSETLIQVLESPLKGIQNKFEHRVGGKFNSNFRSNVTYLAHALNHKLSQNISVDKLNLATSFITSKECFESVNWDFIVKFCDKISNKFVLNFITKCPDKIVNGSSGELILLPENVFEKHLKEISITNRFRINKAVTYENLMRLDADSKIEWLPKLSEIDTKIDRKMINQVYISLDWSKVREKILSEPKLCGLFVDITSYNKDKEVVIKSLDNLSFNISNWSNLLGAFDNFPSDERINVLLDNINSRLSVDDIYTIFGSKNSIYVLDKLLQRGAKFYEVVKSLVNHMVNQKHETEKVMELLLENVNNLGSKIDFNSMVYESMSLDLKKQILKSNTKLSTDGGYYRNNLGISLNDNTRTFFENMNREDLIECLGKDYMFGNYRLYVGHTLTREELQELSDRDNSFLRINLERLNYGYLKKFEDKEKFKRVVGDQRDRDNKFFANKLLNKLQVTNTVNFLANL